jgi:hypothetical protein
MPGRGAGHFREAKTVIRENAVSDAVTNSKPGNPTAK